MTAYLPLLQVPLHSKDMYTDNVQFGTFSSLAVRNSLNSFVLARTGCLAILIRNFSKPFLLASFSSIPDRPIREEVRYISTMFKHYYSTASVA